MAIKKLVIELQYSSDTPDQEEAVRTAARMTAKHLYATALMVAPGKRTPEIALTSNDFFEGRETIELADDFE